MPRRPAWKTPTGADGRLTDDGLALLMREARERLDQPRDRCPDGRVQLRGFLIDVLVALRELNERREPERLNEDPE